jgi:transposase InsO family protein
MDMSDAKWLKALEEENARLKRLLAESPLDQAALNDLLSRKWCREPLSAFGPRTMASDDATTECLAAVVDTSISGRRVARELTALISRRGRPGLIVSDHGTKFTSNAMLTWSEEMGVTWHLIAPGKPMRDTGSARHSIRRCAMSS